MCCFGVINEEEEEDDDDDDDVDAVPSLHKPRYIVYTVYRSTPGYSSFSLCIMPFAAAFPICLYFA